MLIINIFLIVILYVFLHALFNADKNEFIDYNGAYFAFTIIMAVLLLLSIILSSVLKDVKIFILIVLHLVAYFYIFDKISIYIVNLKNLHDIG